MTPEEYIAMVEEENKNLKEKLSEITMVADDEKQSIEHILELEEENKNLRAYADNLDSENDNQAIEIEELKKENKKLKEDNRFLTKISKEYMEKENIVEVTEFTELYKDDLEEENEKLKLHIEAKDKAYMSLLTDYNYLQARIKRMEK